LFSRADDREKTLDLRAKWFQFPYATSTVIEGDVASIWIINVSGQVLR